VLLGLAAREDWNCFGMNCERFNTGFSHLTFAMMLATVTLTLWSGVAYLTKNRQIFLRDA
jgi:hypothetical protein